MQGQEVLEIVLKTADELAKEGHDWEGDVWDFVSASVAVSDCLNSISVELLHKEMCGSSFLTGESEIFFSWHKGRPQITVLPTISVGA
tara:strand:+ start:216 stop:479 length:264 start_codon:yes stop_codon:yes gene_type:complete